MTLGPCQDRQGFSKREPHHCSLLRMVQLIHTCLGLQGVWDLLQPGSQPPLFGGGPWSHSPSPRLCAPSLRLQVPLDMGWGHNLGKWGYCWYRAQSSWLSTPGSQETELLTVFAALNKCPKTQNGAQKSWILVPELPQPVVWRWELFRFQGSDPLSVNWGMWCNDH